MPALCERSLNLSKFSLCCQKVLSVSLDFCGRKIVLFCGTVLKFRFSSLFFCHFSASSFVVTNDFILHKGTKRRQWDTTSVSNPCLGLKYYSLQINGHQNLSKRISKLLKLLLEFLCSEKFRTKSGSEEYKEKASSELIKGNLLVTHRGSNTHTL